MRATRTGGAAASLTSGKRSIGRSLPAGPEHPKGGGGPESWDWLAKCERPRRLAGEVLEGVPLSN